MITVQITGIAAAMKKFSPEELDKRKVAAMNESLAMLKGMVQERTPVDRGILRGSIFTELRGEPANLRGIVAPGPATKEYAPVMELGRKPGGKMPPVSAIAAWAHRKGIMISAFVLARSIARKGIKGHFMFRDAARKGKGRVLAIWKKHLSTL